MCIQRTTFILLIFSLFGFAGKSAQAAAPQDAYQIEIVAEAMRDAGRAESVKKQLYASPGVMAVDANLENRTIAVTVSRQQGASLEQLWQAVAAGEGRPSKLTTAEAAFSITGAEALAGNVLPAPGTTYVVIDNLHCKGCARKIASQLYTVRGVSEVRADMQKSTMTVKNNSGQNLSPWALLGAVVNAKERPLAIVGASGRMDISWLVPKTQSAHQASNQSNNGGVQR